MEIETITQASSSEDIYPNPILHIDNLPHDVMLQVFRYLPMYDLLRGAALVCKNWYDITKQPSLWKVLRLRGQLKVDDEILCRMTSLSPFVVYLDISDNKHVTDDGLIAILQKCRTLKTLKLKRCNQLTVRGLKAIGLYCHQLQTLSVNGCEQFTDEVVSEIVHGCKCLRVCSMDYSCEVTYDGLEALALGCPLMEFLKYNDSKEFTDHGLAAISVRCPDTEELHSPGCFLSDQGLAHISKFPRLRKLDILTELSKKTLMEILRCCPLLEILSLYLIVDIDECMETMGQYSRHLQQLSLDSCDVTDEGLSSLADNCKTLTSVDLSQCSRVTDDSVRRLVQCCPLLVYFRLSCCGSVLGETIDQLAIDYRRVNFSTYKELTHMGDMAEVHHMPEEMDFE